MNPMIGVWFGAFVIFLIIEGLTVGVVSAWFAVGAFAALIVALCGGPIWLQGLVFAVISVVLLISLRPVTKKYFTPKLMKTNVDSVVGTVGPVLEDIDNVRAQGRIKLGGMEWSARSTTGDPIKKDTLVRVDRIEGVKVFVSIK